LPVDPWCSDLATDIELSLGSNSVNNLGGFANLAKKWWQQKDPEHIRWTNVATFDGKQLDLLAEEVGTAYKDSANYRYNRKTAYEWGNENNGDPYPGTGVGAIACLKPGTYTFKCTLVEAGTTNPVEVDYFSMTYFDFDGKKEAAKTCDATGAKAKNPPGAEEQADNGHFHFGSASESPYLEDWGCAEGGGCAELECSAKAAHKEITEPKNKAGWDHLTGDSRKAAITFHFKQRSSFEMTYTTNHPHRWFLFKGTRSLCGDDDGSSSDGSSKFKIGANTHHR